MPFNVSKTGAACGAVVTGVNLAQDLSADLIAELRAQWLEHKVLVFPEQRLSNQDLEKFTLAFGEFGEDPFFGHIPGHPHIAAIERAADEKTPIFAEIFHSDWSFMSVPPAGTVLYSLVIPPQGGNTLFANQVLAYQRMPDPLREKVEGLTAIHSAARGYAPNGLYGSADQESGRSMQIKAGPEALEQFPHPLIRCHPETGEKAIFSSAAYILSFEQLDAQESEALLLELYVHQTKEEFIYSHRWQKDMLVMWDNRSLLHAATGGYDGYARLLHRTTIADTQF